MGNAIERLAESNFMKKLQEISQKLTTNEIFATISGGMGATDGAHNDRSRYPGNMCFG